MTKARRMLAQSVLAMLSLLAAAAVCEVALRMFHPKYENVAEGHHYHADVSRLWSPAPNSSHLFIQPDSGARIPVIYNEFGMRQHRRFDADKLGHTTNVAFFGDSYTENRRIKSAHSFTESLDFFLNLREDPVFNVLNFGVDGYGPGQQFISYQQFEHRDELDYVVYVFCDNDIGDFHRHGLFSLDESGGLAATTAYRTSFWRRLLSRLHLTYLALDVAHHMELRSGGERAARRRQKGSAFSGDALDNSIAAFQSLLLNWKQDVEAHGGKFYVATLPMLPKAHVEEIIPTAIDIVDLHDCFSDALPSYDYHAVRFEDDVRWAVRFKNDLHWNERGNMVAAHCLHRFLEAEAGLPSLSDDVLVESRYEYYRAVDLDDGWMPSSTWARRPATMRHDPDVIRAKYLALEQARHDRSLELAVDSPVLARAEWDIHRVQDDAADRDSLIYVKTACDEDDLARTFFLHVVPVDPEDLPPERRTVGYASLDFGFAQRGGSRFDGRCVVGTALPAYEIAAVYTGQFSVSDGEFQRFWQVEVAADEMQ